MASGNNEVLLKLEGTNPGGSVKDRAALQMILAAEESGLIKPGDMLVEATSGNTGIALAMVAAARGYRMKLIMPANQSEERKQSMRAYGAELILVAKEEGMEGARDLADRMHDEGAALKLDQFANPANPLGHVRGTGPELWEQTGGKITHFVSAMGTTGTISGCASYFKEVRKAAVEIIGCQPAAGASIPGIRKWPDEYVPKILRADLIDRYIEIAQQDAEDTTRAHRRDHLRPGRPLSFHLRVQIGPVQAAVFDIETVPDPELLRRCYQDADASDEAVIERAKKEALEKGGSGMLPMQFHKIACISLVYRDAAKGILRISSKRPPDQSEKEILEAFFLLIDRHSPQLVSWNGSGFDLPVIHLRALKHRVVCETYWQGPGNRYEQYTSRYSDNHIDVMDKLALHQPRCYSKLETAALACSLPGKMGISGDSVHEMWKAGKYKQIADYCETDVLNTYLLWLRFMMISGHLTPDEHDGDCEALAAELASSQAPHLLEFHSRWIGGGGKNS